MAIKPVNINTFQTEETGYIHQSQKINYLVNSLIALGLLGGGLALMFGPGIRGGVYYYTGLAMVIAVAVPLAVMIGLAVHYHKKNQQLEENPHQYYLERLSFVEFIQHLKAFALQEEANFQKQYEAVESALAGDGRATSALNTLSVENQKMFEALAHAPFFKEKRHSVEEGPLDSSQRAALVEFEKIDAPYFKIALLHKHGVVGGGIKDSKAPSLFPRNVPLPILKSMDCQDDTELRNVGRHFALALKSFGQTLLDPLLRNDVSFADYLYARPLAAILASVSYAEVDATIIQKCKEAWAKNKRSVVADRIENAQNFMAAYGASTAAMHAFAKALKEA